MKIYFYHLKILNLFFNQFIIPKQYVKILFDYNNEGAKDNYISISKFVNKYYEESESDKSNKSLNDKSNNTSLNERPNSR